MAVRKAGDISVIDLPEMERARFSMGILGVTPLICNRLSEKAKRELLLPTGRKNAATRASTLKHDPVGEFQASPYILTDPDSPTLLGVMAASFKRAIMTAALDMPGTAKTQIGRLVHVEGHILPVWGDPRMFATITRSADMNRTPDVRTRAIIPAWAAEVTVSYTSPLLTEKAVTSLLNMAGNTAGIGDWRPEKGSGTFGQYKLCSVDDPAFLKIQKHGARGVQEMSMKEAHPYDADTAELVAWFDSEVTKRGATTGERLF